MARQRKSTQGKPPPEKSPKADGTSGGSRRDSHSEVKKEMDSSVLNKIALFFICIGLWIVHFKYLNTLFENDRHFSHLADFEREMTYRTEMGLYYSYYKTIINSESFGQGLYKVMNDNVTEYGHTINTLNRFNLYPEVFLAPLYRTFSYFTRSLSIRTQDCYWINRGQGLEPVESCEGIGNAHYFYIYGAFLFAGSTLPSMYILGYLLGNGHIGGIVSTAGFMFNHGEATRAQWTPPLRETFAYPVFLAQIAVITIILNTVFMLFWQFAQFAFATQIAAIYAGYVLEYVKTENLKPLVRSYMTSFVISLGLLFGNRMLLSSLYFSSIMAVNGALILKPILNKIVFRPFYIILHLILYIGIIIMTKYVMNAVFDIRDDDHIFDILKSKFTNFANFHTQLYTCAVEFDFLTFEYVKKLSLTGLIPCAAISVIFILVMLVTWECNWTGFFYRNNNLNGKPFAELVYHLVQLILFSIMGWMIMRLKLFLTPELCGISSVILNKHFMSDVMKFRPHKYRIPLAIALLSMMAYKGHENIRDQLRIQGEYSNPEQENLFLWIEKNTKLNDVFAGSMPVMANLKLSTNRPIVNHPHYENEEIRNRTLKVYSMYSRKSLNEVNQILKKMGVDYYVFQPHSCTGKHPKPNCTYVEMWDMVEPELKGRESICDIFEKAMKMKNQKLLNPFNLVYSSQSYVILRV